MNSVHLLPSAIGSGGNPSRDELRALALLVAGGAKGIAYAIGSLRDVSAMHQARPVAINAQSFATGVACVGEAVIRA